MDKLNPVGPRGVIRYGVLIILVALAICACLTGCDERKSHSKPTKYGGTLYFGVETPFHGFDVLAIPSGGILLPAMAKLNSIIQEPLFRMDKFGNLIPVLGLSATLSENGRYWDIQLRKGVFS